MSEKRYVVGTRPVQIAKLALQGFGRDVATLLDVLAEHTVVDGWLRTLAHRSQHYHCVARYRGLLHALS